MSGSPKKEKLMHLLHRKGVDEKGIFATNIFFVVALFTLMFIVLYYRIDNSVGHEQLLFYLNWAINMLFVLSILLVAVEQYCASKRINRALNIK